MIPQINRNAENESPYSIDVLVKNSDRVENMHLYFEVEMSRARFIHGLTSIHYRKMYDKFLFYPTILLTLISGLFSFAASGSLSLSDDIKQIFAGCVGVMSLVSIFMQSLTKQLDYSGKATAHEAASVSLRRLQNQLDFQSVTLSNSSLLTTKDTNDDNDNNGDEKQEEKEKKEEKDVAFDSHTKNDFRHLSEKFEQATAHINSILPPRITTAFRSIDTHIDLYYDTKESNQPSPPNNNKNGGNGNTKNKKSLSNMFPSTMLSKEKLKLAAYSELELVIISSKGWPYILPNAGSTVEKTISRLKVKLSSDDDAV
eukprot:CAMPEP_0197841418 /NCGR_PEP_ID=MMETSP1437-20131217/46164_1 /TAXON_ID=49252 ORGANISM="Eucampia antarctica, Strain CCMP1452" /NCGR_SAMPLE_ID=MMETSP1437 /ASSEMBLY_ACC=CAM_ASM_001096 /LENGTH=313 /DNA_ID=CAMNT_0043451167 /DNA_START=14 /DNA_END=955 /DNA_ORIENTATION=+